MEAEGRLSERDNQTIMESLVDIRSGVNLLVGELLEEDEDDGLGEEEED